MHLTPPLKIFTDLRALAGYGASTPGIGAGLDFDQTPAAVRAPMQDVHADEHAAVLECALEDRRDLGVRD